MIVTVTLNPSLDKTLSVDRLQPGQVHRARLLRQDLGGKGINVSRALRALGLESKIVALVAGVAGERLRRELGAQGFDVLFIEVEGETRQNLTLYDETAGMYTKVNEPGPFSTPAQISRLTVEIERLARAGDLWAFCGSLPPGAPDDLYGQLIQLVQKRGGLAFLDSSGRALQTGAAARPFGLKPNSDEAAELVGRPLANAGDYIVAARQLHAAGIAMTVITRGAQGAVLNFHGDVIVAEFPPIKARSPVAAGDAALAGLLWAMSDHCNAEESARRIIACGVAAALQEGSEVGERGLVQQLMVRVQLSRPSLEGPSEERI